MNMEEMKMRLQEEKDYCWANAIVSTVICFYKADGNKELYSHYIKELNGSYTSNTKMNIARRILANVGLEYAWILSGDNMKKYFLSVFKNIFSTSFVNHTYRQACDRGALFTQAWKQNFICPHCGKVLDMNIVDKNNPSFVEGDHITPVSKVGYRTDWMQSFYGNNYISVLAVHRKCNMNKATNEVLIPTLQDMKMTTMSDMIERIKML